MAVSKVIGLDIGTSSIKMVEINRSRKRLDLGFVGLAPLSQGAIVEKSIKKPEEVAGKIKELYSNSRSRVRNISTSLAGKAVIIKQATIALMSDRELEKLIQIEAEPYIPFDMDDVNLDFFILDETSGKPGFMEVVLVAVKRDFMGEYIDLIASLDLVPTVVDVDPFTLEVMYEFCYPDVLDEIVALVNVGAATINVNILMSGASQFTRDLPLGGDHVTKEIMRFFNVSFDRAENMKRGALLGNVSPANLETIFSRYVELYLSELKKIFDFFSANVSKHSVERIFLSGGAAIMYGLPSAVQREFNVPAEVVDPFRGLQVNPTLFDLDYLAHIGPSMAIAVGLALRDEKDKLD
ncbi:MAG: type IV pilus assembly protein PilM [Desulfomonile sp.]